MNLTQIVNMLLRMVMHRLLKTGVDAGIDAAAKVGRKKRPQQQEFDEDGNPLPRQQPSPEQRAQRRQARQARQAAKIVRRITRM